MERNKWLERAEQKLDQRLEHYLNVTLPKIDPRWADVLANQPDVRQTVIDSYHQTITETKDELERFGDEYDVWIDDNGFVASRKTINGLPVTRA